MPFITDIIQGDLGSDLYKIHSKWASIFQYSTEYDSEELIQRVQGYIEKGNLSTGQPYAKDAYVELVKEYVSTGPSIFWEKRGVCIHFARSLAALYYCYFDIVRRPYSVYVLDILIGKSTALHECVLIKDNHGKVAIIDWSAITADNGKVTFMPIHEAVKLHERYWGSQSINYNYVYSRYGEIVWAWDQDEFYTWASGSE
jgi:hypothetical protein